MKGAYSIYKRTFYARGGFSNPKQFRKQRGAAWVYYSLT